MSVFDEVICSKAASGMAFERKRAEVFFAVDGGHEVGFVLFFHNFSTFLGRPASIWRIAFSLPEYRGHGYGKALLQQLARIAIDRGCGRLE